MALESVTIGPMGPEDITAVLDLEKDTLSAWNEEHLKDELKQPTGFQFVVRGRESDRVLAVLFGRIIDEEAEILKLSVANSARNSGLGFRLLDFALDYSAIKGVKNCYLELRASNEAARHLYEKRGFTVTGKRSNYYSEPDEDAILMQLDL